MEKSNMVILSWPDVRNNPLFSHEIKKLMRKQQFSEKFKSLLSATKTSAILKMETVEAAQKLIDYFDGKCVGKIKGTSMESAPLGKLKVLFMLQSILEIFYEMIIMCVKTGERFI